LGRNAKNGEFRRAGPLPKVWGQSWQWEKNAIEILTVHVHSRNAALFRVIALDYEVLEKEKKPTSKKIFKRRTVPLIDRETKAVGTDRG